MSQPEPDPPRPRSNFLLCCSSSDLQGRPPIRITKGMNRSRSGFHAQAAFSGYASVGHSALFDNNDCQLEMGTTGSSANFSFQELLREASAGKIARRSTSK